MRVSKSLCQQFQALVTRGKSPATLETLTRADSPASSTVRYYAGSSVDYVIFHLKLYLVYKNLFSEAAFKPGYIALRSLVQEWELVD